jgi:hypothetical protein
MVLGLSALPARYDHRLRRAAGRPNLLVIDE